MRYEMMLPHQIRTAHRPVALPLGVLEYHGEHMAVGREAITLARAENLTVYDASYLELTVRRSATLAS